MFNASPEASANLSRDVLADHIAPKKAKKRTDEPTAPAAPPIADGMVRVRVEAALYLLPMPGTTPDKPVKRGEIVDVPRAEYERVPHVFALVEEIEAAERAAERPVADPSFERLRASRIAEFEAQRAAVEVFEKKIAAEAAEKAKATSEILAAQAVKE